MSRPKQIVHRSNLIQFKVTPIEKRLIQRSADKLNMTISDLCRNAVLDIKVYKPLSDEELEVYKSLVRYKTDFDRIANYFKNSDPLFSVELLKVADEIKIHLQKFRR